MSGPFAMATSKAPLDSTSAAIDPFGAQAKASGPGATAGGENPALPNKGSAGAASASASGDTASAVDAAQTANHTDAESQLPQTVDGTMGTNGLNATDGPSIDPSTPAPRAPPAARPRPADPFAMLTTPSADRLPDPFAPIKSETDLGQSAIPTVANPFGGSAVNPFTGMPMPAGMGTMHAGGHGSAHHPGGGGVANSNGNGDGNGPGNGHNDPFSTSQSGMRAPKWREEIDDDSVLWLPEPDPILTGRKPTPRASLSGGASGCDAKPGVGSDLRVKVEGERKRKADTDDPTTPLPALPRKRGRPSKATLAAREGIVLKEEVKVPKKRGRPSRADLEARARALEGENVDGHAAGDGVDGADEAENGYDDGVDYDVLDDHHLEDEEGMDRSGTAREGAGDVLASPKKTKAVGERLRRQRKPAPTIVDDVPSSPSSRGVSSSTSPSPSPTRSRSPSPAGSRSNTPSAQSPKPKSLAKTARASGSRKKHTATADIPDIDPDAPTATLSPQGYPNSITVPYNEHAVYTFFRYCAERHKMWVRKGQGIPKPQQTEDECMKHSFVGNVFRELDPAGKKDRVVVWEKGERSVEELCFRSFLFTGFYLESTYQALAKGLGEIPNWKNFNLEKYEAILHEYHFVKGNKIYYSGFQMVPPKLLFGREMPSYSATLRLVQSMMEMGLPARLSQCRYAVDASEAIQTIPTFGGFLSLCLITFIQEMSTGDELKFYYRNFASCGPGSRGYLRRIFGEHVIVNKAMELAGLTWLYENQWRYWARLGEDPPHAYELGLRPGMRVLDIENALCWCHKYTANASKYSSLADLPPPEYKPEADEAGPPAWCDEERYVASASRPAYAGDYEEEKAKLGKLAAADLAALNLKAKDAQGEAAAEGEGKGRGKGKGKGKGKAQTPVEEEEEWYEVEKIINRMGDRAKRNGLFRVRWKGYQPEDDTWETETMLRNGSADVLSDWYEWENKVHATISRIKSRFQYKGPEWRDVVQTKKGKEGRAGSKEGSENAEAGQENAGRAASARAQRVRKSTQRFTGNDGDGHEEGVRLDNGDGEGVTIAKEEVDMELPEMPL